MLQSEHQSMLAIIRTTPLPLQNYHFVIHRVESREAGKIRDERAGGGTHTDCHGEYFHWYMHSIRKFNRMHASSRTQLIAAKATTGGEVLFTTAV